MNRLRIQHYFLIRPYRQPAYIFSNRTQKSRVCYSTRSAKFETKRDISTLNTLMKGEYGPLDVGRCTMRNGIKVVAAKTNGSQMAACTILYQGGSRFEYDDQLGVTHFLRTCSSASGCAYSTFSKTRVLHQLGAYITVNSDRQSVAYTLRCPMTAFHDVKYYLLDIAARAKFKQHEVDDRKAQVKLDLQTVHPEALVMDLVQKACWGGGLNNSVFCEEGRIDSMTARDMEDFNTLNMRSDCCSLGSYGLAFEDMMSFAEMIEQKRDAPLRTHCYPASFPRGGFEYHDLGPGSDTWIAVAVPGCGNMDLSCLMKHSIVAAACGSGSHSRGQHHLDHMSHTPLVSCAPDIHTRVKAFNVSYCDTGVFGIIAKTRSCAAAVTARAITKFLKNIGRLTLEQICIGKQRLKLDIALNDDDCVTNSEGLALQAACDVRMDNAYCTIAMLKGIPEAEVARIARSLASKCDAMAVAVVGDVNAVPHDKELKNL